MADVRSPTGEVLPHPPDAMPGAPTIATVPDSDRDEKITLNGKPSFDVDFEPPQNAPLGNPAPPFGQADGAVQKQVTDVLSSGIGIATLLNRLKQSIASAKEYALFLRKRATLEDDHAQSLKKLCRLSQESMRRAEHRQGSFAYAYDEMMHIHERMAENGIQFGASLLQMHEDLIELATIAERNRKSWKTNGLSAEQKVADLEQLMRKSKAKYDGLADEYDRARTGEPRQGGKVFGAFKPKSAAQHEEDLLKKVQAADQVYHGHVQTLQSEKSQLEVSIRPEAVRSLQELIKEIDSGVALQMQKFAAFNEKLLLSNGLIISPIRGQAAENSSQPRSLRQAVAAIDNERDLNDFVVAHHGKVQLNAGEVKYERNPVLNPQPNQYNQSPPFGQSPLSQNPPSSAPYSPNPPQGPAPPSQFGGPQPSFTMGSRSSTGFSGPAANSPSAQGPAPPAGAPYSPPGGQPEPPLPYAQQHNRSFSGGPPGGPPPPQQQQPHYEMPANPPSGGHRYNNGGSISSAGPPQLGALSFQGSQPPVQSSPPAQAPPQFQTHDRRPSGGPGAAPGSASAPTKPIFGLALGRLYERDGLAVPIIVYQCIQAVDLFGLGLEGIYRQSGSMNHILRLKTMFDTDSSNPALDFRNPENFYHDVNSVTGLLKQFFRDLPDPIFTMEHHSSFINAAKQDDDTVRRDSLHAIINSLPDPNYATLRALTLHLHRVMDNSHVNRMNSHNLAVIFGPTLMGTDPSTAIADAGWQIKVIDTILQNTYQIFDED